jgi:UDP-N-acetylglucosamine/UDP-N-acetylgalactosamine 4-epimerase
MTEIVKERLSHSHKKWLITGVAGFIGSNLLEQLLMLGQTVVGLDNFSTGKRENLQDVQKKVGQEAWSRFTFIEGDIRDFNTCNTACIGVDYVLHQAALGSVPRSIEDPMLTHQSNIDGFLNMLIAARDAGTDRFVYASSSAIYGDNPHLPQRESEIGKPLSPYSLTKYVNELYAELFARLYNMKCIGLRYFNVFGPRQDPMGAYAAVIPKWIGELLDGEIPVINGDGKTTRDFCYIDNVVQANILAATSAREEAFNQAYNIAVGETTTLNELFFMIARTMSVYGSGTPNAKPKYGVARIGDIRHSLADAKKAALLLEYCPTCSVQDGMRKTVEWFCAKKRELCTATAEVSDTRRGKSGRTLG